MGPRIVTFHRLRQRLVSFARGLLIRLLRRPRRKRAAPAAYVNRIVTDAVLINEIPSPSEREVLRGDFVTRRLREFGLSNILRDDDGNVAAFVPAVTATEDYILVAAETRAEKFSPMQNLARLEPGVLRGHGVAEPALGAAALLVLAEYLVAEDVRLEKNLVLLFTGFSDETGSGSAFDRFLRCWKGGFLFGFEVRGLGLGTIEDNPTGTLRLTVQVTTKPQDLFRPTAPSAASVLSIIADRLLNVRWDSEDNTVLNVARIAAGSGYGEYPREGSLDLEIYSADAGTLEVASRMVLATIERVAADNAAEVVVTRRLHVPAGQPGLNDYPVSVVRRGLRRVRVREAATRAPGRAAHFNVHGIPAVTIGLTTGAFGPDDERVDLAPLRVGFRLLVGCVEDGMRRWENR